MSTNSDDHTRIEIKNLLKKIDIDMTRLKNELNLVHTLIEETATFPLSVDMVNDKLKLIAKEAGINFDDIVDSSDSDKEESVNEESSEEPTNLVFNNSVATSTKQLTEKMRSLIK